MNPLAPVPSVPPAATPAPAPAGLTPRFSAELRDLIVLFAHRPASLGAILEATQGRGYQMLLLLIALPFVGPVPLPGFSIPFGLTVTLIGLRLAADRKPWLPERLLRRPIPAASLARVLGAASRVMAVVEALLRPRFSFVLEHAIFNRIAGLLFALAGLMMMLPFPLPFSNSLPAWSVLLLAAGGLGRDGLFYFAGCIMFAVSVAFFALVAVGGVEALNFLRHLWTP